MEHCCNGCSIVGVNSTAQATFTSRNSYWNSVCYRTAHLHGGITVSGADSNIYQIRDKIRDGAAATPSLTFDNQIQQVYSDQVQMLLVFLLAGTETRKGKGTGIDLTGLQVDSTLGSTTPFFKVDTAAPKLSIGATATS